MGHWLNFDGAAPAVVLSKTDEFTIDMAGAASGSAASKSLGTADLNRFTYVCVTAYINATITGVTVGGVACSLVIATSITAVGREVRAEIWKVNSGSGTALENSTTATIGVTFSGAEAVLDDIGITVFKLVGGSNTNTNSTATGDDPQSVSVTIPTGAGLIATANLRSNINTAWTSATEDSDFDAGDSGRHSSAHNVTAGSPTITAETTGTFKMALVATVIT